MNEADLILVGIIMAIQEFGTKQLELPEKVKKCLPIFTVALGLGAGFLFSTGDVRTDLLRGLILGLTATGTYSAGKNVLQAFKKQ